MRAMPEHSAMATHINTHSVAILAVIVLEASAVKADMVFPLPAGSPMAGLLHGVPRRSPQFESIEHLHFGWIFPENLTPQSAKLLLFTTLLDARWLCHWRLASCRGDWLGRSRVWISRKPSDRAQTLAAAGADGFIEG